MLAAFQTFLLILAAVFLLASILGMVQPVIALWFLARFNRLKVLKFYGKAFLVTILLWVILSAFGML